MKGQMHGWGLFAAIVGVLTLIGGGVWFALTAGASGISFIGYGLALLLFNSVCNWMDDLLELLGDIRKGLADQHNLTSEETHKINQSINAQSDLLVDVANKMLSTREIQHGGTGNAETNKPKERRRAPQPQEAMQPEQPGPDVAAALAYAKELDKK